MNEEIVEMVPKDELDACKAQVVELNAILCDLSDKALMYLNDLMEAKSEIIRLHAAIDDLNLHVDTYYMYDYKSK